jgi:hypothetical protein
MPSLFHPRKLLIAIGVVLLIFGGWSAWRAAHPPLTDEQQIAANIEVLRLAVQSRKSRNITNLLADDFTWNGQNKRELNSELTGAFLQWRDITANVTGLQISLNGDKATSKGKFSLAFRPSQRGRPEAYLVDFQLTWQKRDGQWLIIKAEGGENAG